MTEPHFALRYMRRFECVGPACPATCCSGWSVPVDEAHYRSLETAMSGSSGERARFKAAHVPVDAPTTRRHRHLKLVSNGDCSLLGEDKLCGTHKAYGESYLPDTCATYPRTLGSVGGRLELASTLSCPEAARLAITAEDAIELDAFDPATLPRLVLGNVHDEKSGMYGMYLDDVRSTVMSLLAHKELTLATRLFLVSRFADRTRLTLHRGAGLVDECLLGAEIASATDPVQIDKWAAAYEALTPTGPRAGFVIVHALKERLDDELGVSSFRALVRRVFEDYSSAGGVQDDEASVDPAALMPAYFARRALWQTQHGARLDAMFTNYCMHYWMAKWYVDSPDLLVHAQKLHLRLALLRFLVLSHPDLGQPGDRDAAARLESIAVEVVYVFSRAVEHQHEFTAKLEAMLVRLELASVAQAIFLLAV